MSERPEGTASLRCFVALDLEPALLADIARVAGLLRPLFPGLRWVGLDGVHLTLRFLGTSSPAQIARLEPALAAAAAACPPMSVGLRGLDTFPARGSPRVLHLALEARPSLMALQAVCEAAAQATGYPPEARPFHPHLTLGRWRERAVRPSLPRVALPAAAHLSTLTLFRSQTRPDGAVYTRLRRFALGTEASP